MCDSWKAAGLLHLKVLAMAIKFEFSLLFIDEGKTECLGLSMDGPLCLGAICDGGIHKY